MPSDEGKSSLGRSSGRFEITERPDGVTLSNDAYNTCPINVLIAVGEGDPRAMTPEASDAEIAVHTVEDVAGLSGWPPS